MKGVEITTAGGPEVLQLKDVEDVKAGPGECLVKVAAAGCNGADLMQRRGVYPPPAGSSLLPGLECSGVVEALGEGVTKWKVGDKVCALLTGGGYAEKVNVPERQLLPIPKGVSLTDAGGLPEVSCTVWSTVFMTSKLTKGETFLVHGGTSGIGGFAIQLAKAKGVKTVVTTVGSAAKAKFAKDLGADVVVNYKEEDFVAKVKEATGGKGVNVILDNMGGSYLERNVDALSVDGRLFIIGWMGGIEGKVNLGPFVAKRLTLQSAGLRARSPENKGEICEDVVKNVWGEFEAGTVKPLTHGTFPMAEASKAHALLESSAHMGKVLLVA